MEKLTNVYTYDPCSTDQVLAGAQIWYKNGVVHRDADLPAIVQANGTLTYVQDGEVHRAGDLPAIVKPNGTKMWFSHGKRHRAGGAPAVVSASRIEYYVNDTRHRDGGPADILIRPGYAVGPGRSPGYRVCEYRRHGIVHRNERDEQGLLLPAVYTEPRGTYIADKYYLDGVEVNRDGTPCENEL